MIKRLFSHSILIAFCYSFAIGFIPSLFAQSAELPDDIRQYLTENASHWNLEKSDWQEAVVKDRYTNSKTKTTHIYLQQKYQGIEVSQGIITLALNPKGRIVHATSRFVPSLANQLGPNIAPEIEAIQALTIAAKHLSLKPIESFRITKASKTVDQAMLFNPAGISKEAIPVKLVIESQGKGKAHLCWYAQIKTLDDIHWWNVSVNSKTANIVSVDDWVIHDHWGNGSFEHHSCINHKHDIKSTSPPLYFSPSNAVVDGASYEVFPLGVESPSHGERIIVANPADELASPFGWHDVDGISGAEFGITRGNNVWAREDRDANNVQGDEALGDENLSFSFPFSLPALPSENLDASITNLFYWGNICHDIWYQYGFDEVSGNFQENNYDKGGEEGDFVFIDALDGSGFNNANFIPPPDGQNGRMQMFIWTGEGGSRRLLEVFNPGAVIGKYNSEPAAFGPALISNPVDGEVVLVNDNSAFPERACSPLINAQALRGKIALLSRGDCLFTEKVKRVQDAGAIGVIVGNNEPGPPIVMGGDDPSINIPSIMISLEDYETLKSVVSELVVNLSFEELPSDIDSGFDNGIVAHEYGHGISTRLTGGPSTNCLGNDEQMGEGWSDWVGLVMTVKPGDTNITPRPVATFAAGQNTSGNGIRPFPYTTDMSVNPHTYSDIADVSIPHGVGSVWAAMLWDLYWELIDTYGFDSDLYNGEGGNNIAMQLVIDGMKLQACSPGFVDGRDAILMADSLNYGGANQCLIWEVFARRGLGFSADQGSSTSVNDGNEAFDLPQSCRRELQLFVNADTDTVAANGTLAYEYIIANTTAQNLTDLTIFDTLDTEFTYLPDPQDCNLLTSDSIISFSIPELAAGDSFFCSINIQVNAPDFSTLVFSENFESEVTDWQEIATTGNDGWEQRNNIGRNGSSAYVVPNAPRENDQRLVTPFFELPENAEFSFWHSFSTEFRWDGGIVEFQTDLPRAQWQDAGPFMVQNPYVSFLGDNNPGGSVPAFTGESGGFILTRINVSEFSGQNIRFRFRMLSDNNTGGEGWIIDDVAISNRISINNRTLVIASEGDSAEDSAQVAVSSFITSISNLAEDLGIILYPNPAQNEVRISWPEVQNNEMEISLLNTMGQRIIQQQIKGQRNLTLNISDIPAGVYFVEFRQGDNSGAKKLIIQ